MIKSWQKAALGMMAGAGLYSGVLYHLEEHTKQLNQHKAEVKTKLAVSASRQQKTAQLLQDEKRQLDTLQSNLRQFQQHTQKVQGNIGQVEQEIRRLNAGIVKGHVNLAQLDQVKITPPAPPPVASIQPIPKQQVSNTPPPVQTVTRASGG